VSDSKIYNFIDRLVEIGAVICAPNIVLFFLYNQNRVITTFNIMHFLIFALCVSTISVLSYIAFLFIIKKKYCVLIPLVLEWVVFWYFWVCICRLG
jgi:hypothetical protein